MSMPEKSSPFNLLVKINQLYSGIEGLPDYQRVQAQSWMGIGFRLGKYHFVIDIKDLEEILMEPIYTVIPIVKPWLKGVANMRGHLLAVIDLSKLFGITSEATYKQRRVMAIKMPEGGYVGFVVDTVFGMQSFLAEDLLSLSLAIPDVLQPFIKGVYTGEQQKWLIFDTQTFMNSSLFLDIGR